MRRWNRCGRTRHLSCDPRRVELAAERQGDELGAVRADVDPEDRVSRPRSQHLSATLGRDVVETVESAVAAGEEIGEAVEGVATPEGVSGTFLPEKGVERATGAARRILRDLQPAAEEAPAEPPWP